MNLKNNEIKKDTFKTQFKVNKQRSTMNAIVITKRIKLFLVYTETNNKQKKLE